MAELSIPIFHSLTNSTKPGSAPVKSLQNPAFLTVGALPKVADIIGVERMIWIGWVCCVTEGSTKP